MTTIRSLQDMCIDSLVENFEHLWTYSKDNQDKIVWCDPDLGLPGDVPEKLMSRLSEQTKLNNGTLSLFLSEHACLKDVTIPYASQITKEGLKILKSHHLLSLDICDASLTMIDVLKCLGSQNWASLKSFRCKDLKWRLLYHPSFSHSSNRYFPRLDSVCCLSLINLGLTDSCLDIILSNVPNLQKLDISENFNITNISPLQKSAERLQELIMHRLLKLTEVTTVDTLRKLKQLRHLDVSVKERREFPGLFQTRSLLMDPSTDPNLTSLDLCGREEVTEEMLGAFLDAHPSLTFLGLLCNEASDYPMFDVKSPQYRPGIKVAGTSNLDQMALSLRRYHKSHPIHYGHVLDWLECIEISSMTTENDDIIRAILKVMQSNMQFEDITSYDTKQCLDALKEILRCRCVSHIQPDTVRQLLRTCHLLLKLPEPMHPLQIILKQYCKKQAERIVHICENLKTD